jgi:hypothetical protein
MIAVSPCHRHYAAVQVRTRCLQLGITLAVFLCSTSLIISQTATISVTPEADTFVRASDPSVNYGGAGAIAVSGPAAVNATNQQNGAFNSLIRFPMNGVVTLLDSTLGANDWLLLRATLKLTEMGAPPSPIFNRGIGIFELRWLAADSWTEGTGIPATPTTDGVTWNDLPSLLNSAKDVSLGQFTNTGTDTRLSFVLAPQDSFVSNIHAGGRLTLYLTAVSPQIGFTADSRSFISSNDFPVLEIVAAANPHPRIDSIENQGTYTILSFDTVSNWTYVVQFADQLSGSWLNLFTLPSQTTNGHVVLPEAKTSSQRFYRLSVSQ